MNRDDMKRQEERKQPTPIKKPRTATTEVVDLVSSSSSSDEHSEPSVHMEDTTSTSSISEVLRILRSEPSTPSTHAEDEEPLARAQSPDMGLDYEPMNLGSDDDANETDESIERKRIQNNKRLTEIKVEMFALEDEKRQIERWMNRHGFL